jgi:ADP-ribosylglycohydrolase
MCILRSFVQQGGKIDPVDIGKKFVSWMRSGPPDIGTLTRVTLSIVARPLFSFYRGAYDEWRKNPNNSPNGSLMRNGVIPALLYPKDETDCIDATVLQSIITHYSPLSVLSCVIQSLLIRNAILQKPSGPPTIEDIQNLIQTSWEKWKTSTTNEYCLHWLNTVQYVLEAAEKQIVEELKNFETTNFYKISYKNRAGYSVLTLQIALWSLYWSYSSTSPPDIPSYLPQWVFKRHQFDTIMWVVLIGADADTYGATAGPLLAAYHGNIHNDFIENLMVKGEISEYYTRQLVPILSRNSEKIET